MARPGRNWPKGRWDGIVYTCTACGEYYAQKSTSAPTSECYRCRKDKGDMSTITGSAGGSAAWASLEADTYPATIQSYEDAGPSKFDPDKSQFAFIYALDLKDDEGEAITLRQWVNQVLSPKSNLAGIITATGLEWEPGKPFDLDNLIGKPVRLMVNVKDGDNGPRPYVSDVIPPKKAEAASTGAKKPGAAVKNVRVEEAVDVTCAVEGCGGALDHYSKGGRPLCESHTPDDL